MKDSKLSDILQVLTADEAADFDRFLDYSLPRTRHEVATDDIKKLWQTWYKPKKKKSIAELTTEETFRYIFPEKAFVKGRMEKIMSELMSELEKWLGFKHITEGSIFEQMQATLRFLSQRQLNNRFEQTLNRLRAKYNHSQPRNTTDYLDAYLVEMLDKEHQEHLNTKRGDLNLSATLGALDTYFVVSWLDLMLVLVAQRRHIGLDISEELAVLADIENLIEKKQLRQNPMIDVNLAGLKLLLEEKNYPEFREKLAAAEPHLTFEQRRHLHAIERNFCSFLCIRGHQEWLPLLGDLNEQHLEAGYLYYRNTLVPSALLNLTVVGMRLKRFAWVEKMLLSHKEKISVADDPAETWRVAWAFYLNGKGDYKAALENLQSAYRFQDVYFDLTQRRLEIKIFVEQKDYELANSRNEAFKNYLFNRSKKKAEDFLPNNAFEPNNQFVNFVDALLNLPPKDPEKRQQLLEKLQKMRMVADFDWLMEKLS